MAIMTSMKMSAEAAANALKKKMKGKGWKTEVWENMGWNYHVKNGPITVIEYRGTYTATIGEDGNGNGCWTGCKACERFTDPNRAVFYAVRRARRQLDECIKIVKIGEKIVGRPKQWQR